MHHELLVEYFTHGITSKTGETVGAEIETQFIDSAGRAIHREVSQQMLQWLAGNGWSVETRKGELITALVDARGNKIFYELGRHNMEVATIATTPDKVLEITRGCLVQLYAAGRAFGAYPYFASILETDEDLLVIPDERDAIWLELDGRESLALLARTSSVQFTVSVAAEDALRILNALGDNVNMFLANYPQDLVWKRYIAESHAGYLPNRYGGPLRFSSINDYCEQMVQHSVVRGTRLLPFTDVNDLDVPLYVRSIWWHFRLKRYGNALCIEVRPMARRVDDQFNAQLQRVLAFF